MELRWINDAEGVSRRDVAELPDLLERTDGFLWLDIPTWSEDAEDLLANRFAFHPMAIDDCRNRNHIPRVHVYPNHLFLVIHAPEIGTGGHVHYLELDQFIGEHFLVTVHGPLNRRSRWRRRCGRPRRWARGWSRAGCIRPRRSI